MLARILTESDPFGEDHHAILGALDAVARLANEQAVGPIVTLMKRKKLFQRKKARAFKTASVRALVAIGTPKAKAALDDVAINGDRLLKTIVRSAGSASPKPREGGPS
jgi:hypothetical protein